MCKKNYIFWSFNLETLNDPHFTIFASKVSYRDSVKDRLWYYWIISIKLKDCAIKRNTTMKFETRLKFCESNSLLFWYYQLHPLSSLAIETKLGGNCHDNASCLGDLFLLQNGNLFRRHGKLDCVLSKGCSCCHKKGVGACSSLRLSSWKR